MKLLRIQLILLLPLKIMGCDMCGNFMGITPYDNQGQLMFLHRYRVFNGYRSYQQRSSFVVPGAYRTMHDPTQGMPGDSAVEEHSHSSKDYESYKVFELRAKFFLHPRWELNAILPFQQIKTKYDDDRSANTSFSDPSLFIAYHLLKRLADVKVRQRLILGSGIKLPLGNYRGRDDKGDRLFILNQNGTGSWDGFFYVNYMMSLDYIGFNSNSMIKINGKNDYGERYANSFSEAFSVFAKIEAGKATFYPSVLMNYEYSKGVKLNDEWIAGTNANVILLGPSLDVRLGRIVLNASYQFNVYERVSSQSLANAGRLVAGITYNFVQNK